MRISGYRLIPGTNHFYEPKPFVPSRLWTRINKAASDIVVYKYNTPWPSWYAEFLIVRNGEKQGLIIFDREEGEELALKYDLDPDLTWVTPHAQLSKNMVGKSIVPQLYRMAVQKGVNLITRRHTKAASHTWDKIANMSGVNHFWVERGYLASRPSETAARILTKSRTIKFGPKSKSKSKSKSE